jgi:hypothetical protein
MIVAIISEDEHISLLGKCSFALFKQSTMPPLFHSVPVPNRNIKWESCHNWPSAYFHQILQTDSPKQLQLQVRQLHSDLLDRSDCPDFRSARPEISSLGLFRSVRMRLLNAPWPWDLGDVIEMMMADSITARGTPHAAVKRSVM